MGDTLRAPTFADIDSDGDFDLLVGEQDGSTTYYRNIGTSTSPTFTNLGTAFLGIGKVDSYATPTFADIDGDKDLDLLVGGTGGTIKFFRNIGSSTSPTFTYEGSNLFGLSGFSGQIKPELADLDGDGDLDALVGHSTGTEYFRNIGTSSAPTFTLDGAYNLGIGGSDMGANLPYLVDLDGDGDLDLVQEQYGSGLMFYRNVSGVAAPTGLALAAASDSGVAGDRLTNVEAPAITGSAAGAGVLTLYRDGVAVDATTLSAAGAWTLAAGTLNDGAHTLTAALMSDNRTSPASAALTITIDTSAPQSIAAAVDGRTANVTNDTTPDIAGTADANATILLYDAAGTTALGTAVADGDGFWTATSAALDEGTYSLTARAIDLAGNTSGLLSALTLSIDLTPPDAPGALDLTASSDLGLSDTDNWTGDDTPDISGTTEAGATVLLYGNDGATVLGSAVADSGGAWTITSAPLGDGYHTLTTTAIDPAGNSSGLSGSLVLSIDTALPPTPGAPDLHVWSDTGLSDSDDLTTDTTPTLTGTGTADSTVLLYDGAVLVGTTVADGSGLWTVTTSGLLDGTHTLVARTLGQANISAPSPQLLVTVDTRLDRPDAPDLHPSSDLGPSDSDNVTRNTTPVVTGTTEAGATVLLYDGNLTIGTALADGGGLWSLTTAHMEDGPHTLTVQAVDVAGNTSASSTALTITVDTTAPGVPGLSVAAASDTGRSAADGISSDTTPDITGTAEAGSQVTLYTDGAATGTVVADGYGRWSVTHGTLSEGRHTLTARAADLAGNESGVATMLVTIDTTAPLVAPSIALAPASDSGTKGDLVTTDTTPALTGTAEAGATILLYDGLLSVGTGIADGTTGLWTVTAQRLGIGLHTLTARSSDAAGNGSVDSEPLTLTIKAQPASDGNSVVDGVTVRTGNKINSDGTSSTIVTVPVITTGRVDQMGDGDTADIPLVRNGGGTILLSAQLPTGLGLTASGSAVRTAGTSVNTLIREIQALTTTTSNDQAVLTDGGAAFLDTLPTDTPLLVQTIVPTAAAGAAPTLPLVIAGTPATDGNPLTALIIDGRALPSGTAISLQNVSFAVVVGDVRITGGDGSQTVWADGGAQYIVLGADDDTLHGGGGDDYVGSRTGNDVLFGDGGADTVTGGEDDDIVYGNRQDDAVYGNQGADTLWGGQDQDSLFGGQDGDVAYGNLGRDVVYGNKGDDTLFGGFDADSLFGGQGDDRLFGNAGDDVLTGGLGADVFTFQPGGGHDLVTDFDAEAGDRLVIGEGRGWTVTDGTDGAVLSFVDGATVTLRNARADQVTGSWFSG